MNIGDDIAVVMMALNVCANIADVITTNYDVAHGGKEKTPLTAWAMKAWGKYWWFIKVIVYVPLSALGWVPVYFRVDPNISWVNDFYQAVPVIVMGYYAWHNRNQ